MRPADNSFSLMTSPGVDRTLEDMISPQPVTFVTSAFTPILATAFFAAAATFSQLAQPGPKILIDNNCNNSILIELYTAGLS